MKVNIPTGNGFTTSTAPAYQAECVKSHRKGTILMISAGAFVSLGYALSYWSVFGFAYVNNTDAAWRVPIALQITFALPAITMLFFLPDSPRWLILTGREQEALTVIAALNDDDPDGFEVKDEFLQIKDAILVMAQGTTSKLFSNKDRRGFHRVALAFLVQIFQQGTGINLVLQYLSWILLTRMGYSGWLSRLLASCSATTYFLASFVTVVGIDRFWGRRSLMMFGAAGMSGCTILLTITQYLWTIQGHHPARIASTVFLFGFSIFFAIGWQGMAWLYQVEIVPLRIRGPANALSTFGNWALNFVYVHPRLPSHQHLANQPSVSSSSPPSLLPTSATVPGSFSPPQTLPLSPSSTFSSLKRPSAHSKKSTSFSFLPMKRLATHG
jgi:MFS family permease